MRPVAIGGDLTPESLLAAYSRGHFPWYSDGDPVMWWCPNPRAIIENVRISSSLRRTLRRGLFRVTENRCFRRVMEECAVDRDDGTWILPEMIDAYTRLFELGHAVSVEVWSGEHLAGGLYGVRIGGLFAAESMFHRVTDASKVALVHAVGLGARLFDVQFLTPHLASMGAIEISRDEYLKRLGDAIR